MSTTFAHCRLLFRSYYIYIFFGQGQFFPYSAALSLFVQLSVLPQRKGHTNISTCRLHITINKNTAQYLPYKTTALILRKRSCTHSLAHRAGFSGRPGGTGLLLAAGEAVDGGTVTVNTTGASISSLLANNPLASSVSMSAVTGSEL